MPIILVCIGILYLKKEDEPREGNLTNHIVLTNSIFVFVFGFLFLLGIINKYNKNIFFFIGVKSVLEISF